MHTPGPWRDGGCGRIILNGSNCYLVNEIWNAQGGYNPDDVALMAAAPEMRSLIEDIMCAMEGTCEFTMWDDGWQALYLRCKEVIGEQARSLD